jgi:hypothetical protein
MKAKKLIIAVILLSCIGSVSAQSSVKDAQTFIFDKFSNDPSITTVFVSKAFLEMIADMKDLNTGGVDIKKIAGKLDQLEIYSVNSRTVQYVQHLISRLPKDCGYETLLKVNNNISFYAKEDEDGFKELVMSAEDEEGCVVVRMIGTFTSKDVEQIIKGRKGKK